MLTIFLACFDQFRAVGGMLVACFLFCCSLLYDRIWKNVVY